MLLESVSRDYASTLPSLFVDGLNYVWPRLCVPPSHYLLTRWEWTETKCAEVDILQAVFNWCSVD